jgi:hypothetical protein
MRSPLGSVSSLSARARRVSSSWKQVVAGEGGAPVVVEDGVQRLNPLRVDIAIAEHPRVGLRPRLLHSDTHTAVRMASPLSPAPSTAP